MQKFDPHKDYYEALQVHPKANIASIKKAYRVLLKQLGTLPNEGASDERAQLINEAYEVLSNAQLRREYDNARSALIGDHSRTSKLDETGIIQRNGEAKQFLKSVSQGKIKRKSAAREWAESIVIAVVLALLIRTFVVQAFKIPSGSMLPTLQIGDHILVNKLIYRFEKPSRGDIIVFKFPYGDGKDFIKRVIGLPGETIELRDKQVFINGQPLEETYAIYKDPHILTNPHSPRDNFGPVKVPEGHLFVMGDNRDQSMDSRFWGFLDMGKIKGKAFIIYWSWDREHFRPRWERISKLIH